MDKSFKIWKVLHHKSKLMSTKLSLGHCPRLRDEITNWSEQHLRSNAIEKYVINNTKSIAVFPNFFERLFVFLASKLEQIISQGRQKVVS